MVRKYKPAKPMSENPLLLRPSECMRYTKLRSASFYRYINLNLLVPDGEGRQGQPLFFKETLDNFMNDRVWPDGNQGRGRSLHILASPRPHEDEVHSSGAIIYWSKRFRKENDGQGRTYVPVTCAKCKITFNKGDATLWRSLKINRFTGCCSICSLSAKRHTPVRVPNGHDTGEGYIRRHRLSYTEEELKILSPMLDVNQSYVAEHRATLALHIGRPLAKGEIVHHLNGIKSDNRIENLELTNIGIHNTYYADLIRENLILNKRIAELELENSTLRSLRSV